VESACATETRLRLPYRGCCLSKLVILTTSGMFFGTAFDNVYWVLTLQLRTAKASAFNSDFEDWPTRCEPFTRRVETTGSLYSDFEDWPTLYSTGSHRVGQSSKGSLHSTFVNSISRTFGVLPNLLPCGRLQRSTFKSFYAPKTASTAGQVLE
jgi:hypothetical protein